MLEPWKSGKVVKIENETMNTKRFWIQIEDIDVFSFLPGQFVTLDLPIHEQKNKRWRSYSIASWPNESNIIELIIVLLENGAGTNYLFNEVTVGSLINLRGPIGKFTLEEPLEKELFLICTGTGVAPFRSMVNHLTEKKKNHQNIHLIFGCRKFTDALYFDELKALQKTNPKLHYYPVFSREENVLENMYKGYVHEVYKQIILKNNLKDADFYLCGWKNMIDDAKQTIINLGFDKKNIHFELYG